MKALEGEVELKHHHSRLSPFKHNLLSKEKGIEQIDFVLNIWNYNRLENVSLYLDSVRTLFIPNLNIKELAIIHDEARVNNMKNHKNIVDLEWFRHL